MAEEKLCPRCGEEGSPQVKEVLNAQKKAYRYVYFAHYAGRDGSLTKVRWCYVGKRPEKGEAARTRRSSP